MCRADSTLAHPFESQHARRFGWIVFFFTSALTLFVLVLSFIPILLGFW